MTDHTAIARALFDAFQSGDTNAARALISADVQASQNGGPAMGREALLAFSNAVKAKVPDFRYEDVICQATPEGFVEEHTVRGTLPNDEAINLRLVVVASVVEGQVTSVREYLDSAGAVGLANALAA